MPTEFEPGLVPELLVRNLEASLAFWRGLCGFELRYGREDEGFAYVCLGRAHVMLEQEGLGRNWVTGDLDGPRGRGINFQVTVPDIEPTLASLRTASIALFMQPEQKWYRTGDEESGVQQFLVADPDGYLIRFQSPLGRRAVSTAAAEPLS